MIDRSGVRSFLCQIKEEERYRNVDRERETTYLKTEELFPVSYLFACLSCLLSFSFFWLWQDGGVLVLLHTKHLQIFERAGNCHERKGSSHTIIIQKLCSIKSKWKFVCVGQCGTCYNCREGCQSWSAVWVIQWYVCVFYSSVHLFLNQSSLVKWDPCTVSLPVIPPPPHETVLWPASHKSSILW